MSKFKFCKVVLQVPAGVYPGARWIDDAKRDALRALQSQVKPGTLVREVDNYTVADRVYNIKIDGEVRSLQLQSQRS